MTAVTLVGGVRDGEVIDVIQSLIDTGFFNIMHPIPKVRFSNDGAAPCNMTVYYDSYRLRKEYAPCGNRYRWIAEIEKAAQ